MEKVNIIVKKANWKKNNAEKILEIQNGDTNERILDFIGFEDEYNNFINAINIIKDGKQTTSRFAMQDIGFWVSLNFFKDKDTILVRGSILKYSHTMNDHPNYEDTSRGATGYLTAYRMFSLVNDNSPLRGCQANIIFEGSDIKE